jgi:hypothetical protein
MSSSIQDIHPYVSQRLVTLFDIVARRYQKLVTKQVNLDENVDKVRSNTISSKFFQSIHILNSLPWDQILEFRCDHLW